MGHTDSSPRALVILVAAGPSRLPCLSLYRILDSRNYMRFMQGAYRLCNLLDWLIFWQFETTDCWWIVLHIPMSFGMMMKTIIILLFVQIIHTVIVKNRFFYFDIKRNCFNVTIKERKDDQISVESPGTQYSSTASSKVSSRPFAPVTFCKHLSNHP